jgi:hypothetical protein
MTTTANRPQVDDDSEFRHGAVMAAGNTGLGALFITAIGKVLGMPPWAAFLATVVMTGAVIWSGVHRHPRPLTRMSIIYRATAVIACGGWMWWQLATVPDLGLSNVQTATLVVAWPLTIAAGVGCFSARRLPALIRVAVAGTLLMFTVALTLVLGDHVASWLHSVLFVTDPMPRGWGPAGAWVWQSVLQLLILSAPMAVIGRHAANREQTLADEAERAANAAVPSATPQAKRFLKLVCDTTGEWKDLPQIDRSVPRQKVPTLSIEDIRPWENGAGETYVLNLVHGKNTTVESLRGHTTLWATKMNLPVGCGIEVLNDDESRGVALVKVNRVNVLKQTINYPALLPRSILNAMPLGHTRDGREIGPFFRESSCFLWGQKGSGKTGTIFDIIAGGLQCTDCLVWVVDLNGGAAAKPFLRPWADGKVDRPCIDWVASTLPEVLTMSEVALNIALDRKIHYADLKFEHNSNLMPVGNGETGNPPPEILIVIDEGATVLGMGGGEITEVAKQAKHNLNQIMDLARDAAVNIVFSGLRATADVADTAFKAGTSIRIGMRVTDPAELSHGFNRWDLNPADIPVQGSGFICCGHDENEVLVFKAYFLDPKRNYEVGETTTPWRPYMDERGMQVGGVKYANRWQRTAPQLWKPGPKLTEQRLDELCEYGAVPVSKSDRSAATGAAGAATAVLDRTGPVSGIETHYHLPPTGKPGEGTFADVLEIARRAKEVYLTGQVPDKVPGSVDEVPPDPPVPPTGGGDGPQEPAEPEGLDMDDDPAAEFDRRFRDLANRFDSPDGVLPDNPEDLRQRMVQLPSDSEIAANPRAREVVERILKAHGPLAFGDIYRMVTKGGAWGPAYDISREAVRKALLKPDLKTPVDWLAPRVRNDPYNHIDNVK